MTLRVIGDEREPSIHNIPSDDDQDVVMDVGTNASGDFYLTLRNTKTGERLEFKSEGHAGGSQNRYLGPVLAGFARRLHQQAKTAVDQ